MIYLSGPLNLKMKTLLLKLIRLYQHLIPAGSCRFVPSCSQYSWEAINKYGMIKGVCLSLKRLGRCHPGSAAGYDPIN